MKNEKIIAGILAGSALGIITGILIQKKLNRIKLNNDKLLASHQDNGEDVRAKAKNHLRKVLHKANHVKNMPTSSAHI